MAFRRRPLKKPPLPALSPRNSPRKARSDMATHPVEPGKTEPGEEPAQPNPTRLPVEPEFGPVLPPVEPEDPGVKPPTL
jgi:hypothetical protein